MGFVFRVPESFVDLCNIVCEPSFREKLWDLTLQVIPLLYQSLNSLKIQIQTKKNA